VKLTKQPNWGDVEAPLSVDLHISTPMLINAGKRLLLPSQIFHSVEKPLFPHTDRVNGIYMYYPSREVDQVSIVLTPGLTVESVPQKQAVQLEYAMYSTESVAKAETIRLDRDVAMAGYIFPKDQYPEIKGFYDKVKTFDEQQVILRGSVNAASGN
jgi:hypothetical protein